jgi:hypothetical protein
MYIWFHVDYLCDILFSENEISIRNSLTLQETDKYSLTKTEDHMFMVEEHKLCSSRPSENTFSLPGLSRLFQKGDSGATQSPVATPLAPSGLRSPSRCGRQIGATGSPSGVSLGFKLGFLSLLGLGLVLPLAICVVVGEAVRQRVGEGVAVSFTRVLLKVVPLVLLLLRRPDLAEGTRWCGTPGRANRCFSRWRHLGCLPRVWWGGTPVLLPARLHRC